MGLWTASSWLHAWYGPYEWQLWEQCCVLHGHADRAADHLPFVEHRRAYELLLVLQWRG